VNWRCRPKAVPYLGSRASREQSFTGQTWASMEEPKLSEVPKAVIRQP
jgi:hypothetical protein